jgi:ubiquitin C-terminal hydrolase
MDKENENIVNENQNENEKQNVANENQTGLLIPPLGFVNTGAICYFNALIQSLLSSTHFLRFVLSQETQPPSLFILFFSFIVNEKKWDPFFTSKLLHVMGDFAPNQSSSEYFLKLCEYAKLDDLFKTKTETTTTCKECGKESKVMDIATYFVIDNDLSEFCETTRETEGFNCDQCKKKVTVKIVSQLREPSAVMVISFNKYFEKKNIPYPSGFDIGDYKYKLISTIEHVGVLQGGHYYCRTNRNNQLLKIDDNSISPIGGLESTENTYMAFYECIKSL